MIKSKYDRLSDYFLLTRTFLFVIKRLYRQVLAHLAPNLRGVVVDVGCGFSPYRPLFRNATRYIGVDMMWERSPDLVGDVQALPIATDTADSIFCSEVLEHVLDPDQVIREISRILKPGGSLLVTVPMSWNLHYEPFDFRRYTSYGLWQLLEAHGYEVLQTKRIGGLFSLVGSRLVEGVATEVFRRLRFMPRRLRFCFVLVYTIPTSLFFILLAWMADGFQQTDAIGWAVLSRRRE